MDDLDLRNVNSASNGARDGRISASLNRICRENFPDNEHRTWAIVKTRRVEERSCALIEPEPEDVGHDSIVALFRFGTGDATFETLACHCEESGQYGLLSTEGVDLESIRRNVIW